MKFKTKLFITVSFLSLMIISSIYLYASSGGITGRTKKSTANGCGGCHGGTATPDVIVTFAGPDSVTVNQTANYSVTISKNGKTGAGFDIATKNGTLAPVSTGMILSNGELTHSSNRPMTSGSITLQFTYTAPSTTGTDTLWANGLATNSDGSLSGDDWNWANQKRIIVKNSVGVQNISSEIPGSYKLEQNYPNPFNPSTKIRFSLPEKSFANLTIYDISGKVIENAVNGNLNAGIYEYQLSGNKLSTGVYIYTFKAGGKTFTNKMILIK